MNGASICLATQPLGFIHFFGAGAYLAITSGPGSADHFAPGQWVPTYSNALHGGLAAAIVLLVAANARPGPEIELAFDVRKMAIDSIQVDARDLKLTVDALGQEIREVKANIVGFAHNPLDVAAQKLLIPAALSIIKGMRSKKAQS